MELKTTAKKRKANREAQRRYRERNRERLNTKQRVTQQKYREAHPEYIIAMRERANAYGLAREKLMTLHKEEFYKIILKERHKFYQYRRSAALAKLKKKHKKEFKELYSIELAKMGSA